MLQSSLGPSRPCPSAVNQIASCFKQVSPWRGACPSDSITVLQGDVHRAKTLVSACVLCIWHPGPAVACICHAGLAGACVWHAGLAVAACGMCLPAGPAVQELPLPSLRDASSQVVCSLTAGMGTGRGRSSTRWGRECSMVNGTLHAERNCQSS